jgi:hypothetical protein
MDSIPRSTWLVVHLGFDGGLDRGVESPHLLSAPPALALGASGRIQKTKETAALKVAVSLCSLLYGLMAKRSASSIRPA